MCCHKATTVLVQITLNDRCHRVVRGSGRPVGRVGSGPGIMRFSWVGSGQTFAVSILSCCGISKAWNDSQQLYTEQYDNR